MILTILGFIHLFHCPLIILFPFVVKNHNLDIIYIIYFFFIMFLYTFIDGECPISYLCKTLTNVNYIAGSDITYYPEMEHMLSNKVYIEYYFTITTILYLTLFLIQNAHF